MSLRISTRLIAIGSGKGGTGKTFVSIGLASALARRKERVLLFDADLGLANTSVQLCVGSGGNFERALATGRITADTVVPVDGGAILPGGFDLLAPPAGSGSLANMDIGDAARLIRALRSAERYDRIVIDLAAGVDAVTMAFAASADDCFAVMTADPASLTDAYAFVKLLVRGGARAPGCIVNMVRSESEAKRIAGSLAKTCRTFLKQAPVFAGAIRSDIEVARAIRQQARPGAKPSAAIMALTEIADRLQAPSRPALAVASGMR